MTANGKQHGAVSFVCYIEGNIQPVAVQTVNHFETKFPWVLCKTFRAAFKTKNHAGVAVLQKIKVGIQGNTVYLHGICNALESILFTDHPTDVVILGRNESLSVILRELPENVGRVVRAGKLGTEEERAALERIAAERGMVVVYCDGDMDTEDGLLEIARQGEHIVILNDHDADEEEADLEAIFLLLHLRDLRERFGLQYNITTEMRRENNQNLVSSAYGTDFIVASSMSALLLAQLAESPELLDVFREMLSNEGNELFLKNAGELGCSGSLTVRELRRRALRNGYVLLGYIGGDGESVFDPPLDAVVALQPGDSLIVFGEN